MWRPPPNVRHAATWGPCMTTSTMGRTQARARRPAAAAPRWTRVTRPTMSPRGPGGHGPLGARLSLLEVVTVNGRAAASRFLLGFGCEAVPAGRKRQRYGTPRASSGVDTPAASDRRPAAGFDSLSDSPQGFGVGR